MKKITIFDMVFDAVTLNEASQRIVQAALSGNKGLVVTPNVDHIVTMEKDKQMKEIFQKAMFRFADGMPLVWFSRLVHPFGLPCRVTGADLLFSVAEHASNQGASLFLLGGQPDAARLGAENLVKQYPGLRIAGYYCPPFGFEHDPEECQRIVTMINDANSQILLLGVGAPKQEKWASTWLHLLKVGPVLCIGAAFDFAAGKVLRAPLFVQTAGLEWAWRLAAEPRRLFHRYIVKDSRFLLLAVREFFRLRKNKVQSSL